MAWKDKMLQGYFYRMGSADKIIIDTGYSGAIDYGKFLEGLKFPNELIEESISIFINNKWTTLKDLTDDKERSSTIS